MTYHKKLIESLNTRGETGAAMLMIKMSGDMAAEARSLAYRLYNVCDRKEWAKEAALTTPWSLAGPLFKTRPTASVRLKPRARPPSSSHAKDLNDD